MKEAELRQQREKAALQERLEEMEFEAEVDKLRRDAQDEALRVEGEVWKKYADMDMGAAQDVGDALHSAEKALPVEQHSKIMKQRRRRCTAQR